MITPFMIFNLFIPLVSLTNFNNKITYHTNATKLTPEINIYFTKNFREIYNRQQHLIVPFSLLANKLRARRQASQL